MKPLKSLSSWVWTPNNPTRWCVALFPSPHGSGKTVKVLVFAKNGTAADAAKAAGAEFVGFDDMIKKCVEGWTDFDVAIATPEAMVEVRKLGKVLGPRGLMPNPKTGTVTEDTARAVKEVKAGPVESQARQGRQCVHVLIAKVCSTCSRLRRTRGSLSKPWPRPVLPA